MRHHHVHRNFGNVPKYFLGIFLRIERYSVFIPPGMKNIPAERNSEFIPAGTKIRKHSRNGIIAQVLTSHVNVVGT